MIPAGANPLLLSTDDSSYQVSRSLRFNSADSAYLTRTFSSPTTQGTFTLSLWAKLSSLGTTRNIFGVSTNHSFQFTTGNALNLTFAGTSALTTTALFRDPSAWHHIVWTQSGTSHTLYINGVSAGTATATSNAFNTAVAHQFGAANTANYFNGYLADIHFIDGQALTPSSFAETNATTGQWVPKTYAGTYGTNGFKLNFSNNSAATAATLGADSSGNGNNFTPTNLSVTAGSGNDSLVDTPTNYGTDTGAGGEVRGNYAVFNALDQYTALPLTNGNIQTSASSTDGWNSRSSTMGISSGKWYVEFSMATITAGLQGNPAGVGIIPAATPFTAVNQLVGDTNRGYGFYCPDTTGTAPIKRVSSSSASVGSGSATSTSDVFMVAFDLTNGNAWFGKNGTWYAGNPATGTGASITGIVANTYVFATSIYRDSIYTNNTDAINFGQRAFAYTAPSGFKALCTQNLDAPTIVLPSTVFDAKLYTGTGSSQSITGLGFNPDLVWIKSRSASTDNTLYDSVRGAQARLESNTTDAEVTADAGLTAFNATGFTVNTLAQVNTSAATYVGWCWDESVSAGFDIVTYAGNGTAGRAISHSLGVTPAMILIFNRTSSSYQARVFHQSLGASKNLTIQTTDGDGSTSSERVTAVSSSTFTVSGGIQVNGTSNNYVSYLWAEVSGFSKFGSYTGNGSADGPFVHTGFRPSFVLVKMSSSTGNWTMLDDVREGYNVDNDPLYPNLSNAEGTTDLIDILSNGFKVRTTDATFNTSSGTYIFAAFAESPFKYANAR